jgi:hypothetical protein
MAETAGAVRLTGSRRYVRTDTRHTDLSLLCALRSRPDLTVTCTLIVQAPTAEKPLAASRDGSL